MIRIGIFGATGYTGLELLKLLGRHPAARIAWLTSESSAGQQFGDIFPVPPALGGHTLIPSAEADCAGVDVVFCCLPHVAAQTHVAAARKAGARVIDLSADFRLRDAATYEKWYGHPHQHAELLGEAVYGLPELHRAEIAGANLIANPGCYPTSIILGLAPLARAGWLAGTIIADSKSGVSGAGRTPSLKTHFVEANENLSPYSIGRTHRHLPEMEQELRMRRIGEWANHLFAAPGADQPGDAVHDLRHLAGRGDGGTGAGGLRRDVRRRTVRLSAAEGPGRDLCAYGQHQLLRHRADVRAGHVNADRHIEHRQPGQRRVGAGGAEYECDVWVG